MDNSEKTKMTTTNMGICFGVSLISSSSAANNHHLSWPPSTSSQLLNNTAGNQSPTNSGPLSSTSTHNEGTNAMMMIDMATATNVFDFLLTNHAELLPGDINFLGCASVPVVATNNDSNGGSGGTGSGGGGGPSTSLLSARHSFYQSSSHSKPNSNYYQQQPPQNTTSNKEPFTERDANSQPTR